MEPVRPEDLAWGEADGGISINTVAVATRLNDLLKAIQVLQKQAHDHDPYFGSYVKEPEAT